MIFHPREPPHFQGSIIEEDAKRHLLPLGPEALGPEPVSEPSLEGVVDTLDYGSSVVAGLPFAGPVVAPSRGSFQGVHGSGASFFSWLDDWFGSVSMDQFVKLASVKRAIRAIVTRIIVRANWLDSQGVVPPCDHLVPLTGFPPLFLRVTITMPVFAGRWSSIFVAAVTSPSLLASSHHSQTNSRQTELGAQAPASFSGLVTIAKALLGA